MSPAWRTEKKKKTKPRTKTTPQFHPPDLDGKQGRKKKAKGPKRETQFQEEEAKKKHWRSYSKSDLKGKKEEMKALTDSAVKTSRKPL